jgi:2-keto-3-deoxy-L-rhamnonate aldolase RhmA
MKTIITVSNNSIACIAQIESVLGVENAEDIISVEGIDCVMIGIGDLRYVYSLQIKVILIT